MPFDKSPKGCKCGTREQDQGASAEKEDEGISIG